ncbi:T9SS type A sorting domain-containing protein [Hymenobacter wooponensis]|uniref:T9SS type A sorting domain-containing protein n=1 Tax=Hymenobacter wooponensis TaxID=1525360 RepID=A0A4Z0MRV3_9BACT|nr:T9SS type A sorting domain-containing protein [Hymenobacter wooponensis]TGD81875.1 T9SS type A sorting domain-containing protein [Hymenobacter wooponensis]
MKKNLQLFAAAGLLMMGLGSGSDALGEGSKQLTPNTTGTTGDLTSAANTRAGFLTHDVNLSGSGGQDVSLGFLKPSSWVGPAGQAFNTDYRMHVHLEPGETLYYGVHRQPVSATVRTQSDLILTLRYGSGAGTIVKTNTLLRDQASTNQSTLLTTVNGQPQAGVIATAAQHAAGPLPNAGGYTPLVYTNDTGAAQEFFIEFTQVGEATMTAENRRSDYDFWDFTVRNSSGIEKPGRLYSRHWAFTAGISATTAQTANRLSSKFNLYPMVESEQTPGTYFVKEVELAGMRPLVFFFVSNAFGSDASFGTSFTERRKSQTSKSSYPQYPNFVSNPDAAIWPTAIEPTVSVTPQPFCQAGVTKVAFTTRAAESGQFNILIDLNGTDGYQAGTTDVLIEQSVTANVASTVVWDGKNGSGTQVANNTTVKFNFTSNGAPVHFPVFDAEGNPDGFRVRNARSSDPTAYDLLYWDDSNLSTTNFPNSTSNPRVQLGGLNSTNGVHIWGTTNDTGDNYTVNTWTYGFSVFTGSKTFVYTSVCDNDGDGIADGTDIDDDNDGILDAVEALSGTTTVDPGAFATSSSPIRYLDASYVHPVLGAFLDTNNDGINDYFDTDLDGIPNHFDLDSDGDGLPDAFEANGNTNPTFTSGPTNYTVGSGRNAVVWTYQSLYDPNQGRYVTTAAAAASGAGPSAGVSANGLPDAVETSVTRSVAGSGVSSNESGVSRYVLSDNDNDQRTNGDQVARNYNFLDIDSDNDGITDNIEAQTTAGYRAPSRLDSDKDGLDNAYDPTNGAGVTVGTLLSVTDSEGDGVVDMFDTDSDNDNASKTALPIYKQTSDWTEGFDRNGNGTAGDEIIAQAKLFAANNPSKATYYEVTTNGAGFGGTTLSAFLQDANNNGIPNFLEPGNASYHDDNFNGLVDIYDPVYGGVPSIAPKSTSSGLEAIFRSNGAQVPLPVTLVSFQVQASGSDALVRWTTAQELNSASFDVERSIDGLSFAKVGSLNGKGTTNQRTDYKLVDKGVGNQMITLYYRVRQQDLDGKVAFSEVKAVTFDGNGKASLVTLYPNPINSETILDLMSLPIGEYTVDIMGVEGRKLVTLKAEGGKLLPFPSASLPKGVYLIQIQGNNLSQIVKVVKE